MSNVLTVNKPRRHSLTVTQLLKDPSKYLPQSPLSIHISFHLDSRIRTQISHTHTFLYRLLNEYLVRWGKYIVNCGGCISSD